MLDGDESKPDFSQWTHVEFDEQTMLSYTKVGNKQPLVSFSVVADGLPCFDADAQISRGFYELELNKAEQCPIDPDTGELRNEQFKVLGATPDDQIEDYDRSTLTFEEWSELEQSGALIEPEQSILTFDDWSLLEQNGIARFLEER